MKKVIAFLVIAAFFAASLLIRQGEAQKFTAGSLSNKDRLSMQGVTVKNVFGYIIDTGDADAGFIGSGWDTTYTFPSTHSVVQVTSSNVTDNEQILINGLDSTWAVQLDTVTLTGATKAATTKQWIRINEIKNISATVFAGTVYVFVDCGVTGGVPNVTANILSIAPEEDQKSNQCVYSIPLGYVGYLYEFGYTKMQWAGTDNRVPVNLYYREFGKQFYLVYKLFRGGYRTGPPSTRFNNIPYTLAAKSDVMCDFTAQYNNADLAVSFQLILIED